MKRILLCTHEKDVVSAFHDTFHTAYRIEAVTSVDDCFPYLQQMRPEFIFIDSALLTAFAARSGKVDYAAAIESFRAIYPTCPVFLMTEQARLRDAILFLKAGAVNYVLLPVVPDELRFVVQSYLEAIRVEEELDLLRDSLFKEIGYDLLHTDSPVMKAVYQNVRKVALTDATVLLTGETGTGKGMVARYIHAQSTRSGSPFVSVHCSAMPETLLESELFGHEKGAFTGAVKRKLGRFEIVGDGTVFLDEIGTVNQTIQVKLLQVLQERTFTRIGGEAEIVMKARIVAATNEDLGALTKNDRFRSDLYYRLNVFPIHLPPLRERKEDIPYLVNTVLNKLNDRYGKGIRGVGDGVIEAMQSYRWPGNIRELENLLERSYILETGSKLSLGSLPNELQQGGRFLPGLQISTAKTLADVRKTHVEVVEKEYLHQLLTETKGRIHEASLRAGMTERNLHVLMTKYGFDKKEYK